MSSLTEETEDPQKLREGATAMVFEHQEESPPKWKPILFDR